MYLQGVKGRVVRSQGVNLITNVTFIYKVAADKQMESKDMEVIWVHYKFFKKFMVIRITAAHPSTVQSGVTFVELKDSHYSHLPLNQQRVEISAH